MLTDSPPFTEVFKTLEILHFTIRGVAKSIFMWKHLIIFVCTDGGMEIVKLPQAAQCCLLYICQGKKSCIPPRDTYNVTTADCHCEGVKITKKIAFTDY